MCFNLNSKLYSLQISTFPHFPFRHVYWSCSAKLSLSNLGPHPKILLLIAPFPDSWEKVASCWTMGATEKKRDLLAIRQFGKWTLMITWIWGMPSRMCFLWQLKLVLEIDEWPIRSTKQREDTPWNNRLYPPISSMVTPYTDDILLRPSVDHQVLGGCPRLLQWDWYPVLEPNVTSHPFHIQHQPTKTTSTDRKWQKSPVFHFQPWNYIISPKNPDFPPFQERPSTRKFILLGAPNLPRPCPQALPGGPAYLARSHRLNHHRQDPKRDPRPHQRAPEELHEISLV